MEIFHVLHHSLAAITNMEDRKIEQILKRPELNLNDDLIFGNYILFKKEMNDKNLLTGRLILDQDYVIPKHISEKGLTIFNFPNSEYVFTSYAGSLSKISSIYSRLESDLFNKELNAIFHPILVFPRGFPSDIQEHTSIEIWLATDQNIKADDRRSWNLEEVLRRKRFNFYTW